MPPISLWQPARRWLVIALALSLPVLLGSCGLTTSSEPEIVATRSLAPAPTDTAPPTPTGADPGPLQTEEPDDGPLATEDPLPTPAASGDVPQTVSVTGQIRNGTADAADVPPDLSVRIFSVELDAEGRPTGLLDEQTVQADGTTFTAEAVGINASAVLLAQVTYQDVQFISDPVLGREIDQPPVQLDVTLYEPTDDPSAASFDQIWYIVGASPTEEVAEIFNWYFVRNDTDRVLAGPEGSLRVELPADAYGVRVDNAAEGRFQILTEGERPVVIDSDPLRPGEEDLITITYLLPYEAAQMTLADRLEYQAEGLTVYVARRFELAFEGQGFEDTGPRDIRTLGTYDSYTYQGELDAGTSIAFSISGDTPAASPGAEESSGLEGFLDDNGDLILGLGVLLVMAGFGYLFLDLQRTRARLRAELTAAQHAEDNNLPADREALLDAIAALDDRYTQGEVDEAAYQAQRQRLKDRLRRILQED